MSRRFLPFDEALATVLRAARQHELPIETLPLDDAFGRTLREAIVADEPFPPFANSAMDGFAVASASLAGASPESPVTLRVLETIGAGSVASAAVGRGEAIRIMTGAVIPAGADAVVPIERTSAWRTSNAAEDPDGVLGGPIADPGDTVVIFAPVRPGENVRPAGEDFAVGERLIESGAVVDAGVIAVMAALGHPTADVAIVPRVAILSTGNELIGPGTEIKPGQVRDSNLHMMRALVRAAGAEPGPTWHLADDPTAVGAAIERVKDHCDVIISIGGVSAGDFDPVKQALADLPTVELWRVGMRPGQPQAFGVLEGGKLFFGLPGNPVSSAIVFEMLVRPAIWRMLGRSSLDRPFVRAVMGEAVGSKLGRRDFLRVRLEALSAEDTARLGAPYRAWLTGTQSSGAVSSVLKATGLAVVEPDRDQLATGAHADVLLTSGHAPITR